MEALTYDPPEMRIPKMTVGIRMMLARKTAKLDQAELASVIGIATRSVQNYELGNTKAGRPVLLAWAMATGVPLGWLLEDDYQPDPEPCPNCGTEREPRSRCFSEFTLLMNPNPAKGPPSPGLVSIPRSG